MVMKFNISFIFMMLEYWLCICCCLLVCLILCLCWCVRRIQLDSHGWTSVSVSWRDVVNFTWWCNASCCYWCCPLLYVTSAAANVCHHWPLWWHLSGYCWCWDSIEHVWVCGAGRIVDDSTDAVGRGATARCNTRRRSADAAEAALDSAAAASKCHHACANWHSAADKHHTFTRNNTATATQRGRNPSASCQRADIKCQCRILWTAAHCWS